MTAAEIRARITELRQVEDAARLMLPKYEIGDTTPAVFLRSEGGIVLHHGYVTDEGAIQLRDQLLEWYPLVAPPPNQQVVGQCPACLGIGYIWSQQGANGLTCSRCHGTGAAA